MSVTNKPKTARVFVMIGGEHMWGWDITQDQMFEAMGMMIPDLISALDKDAEKYLLIGAIDPYVAWRKHISSKSE